MCERSLGDGLAESYGELVIELHRSHAENYDVELWVSDPGSAGEIAPVRGQAAISIPTLAKLNQKPAEYGQMLTDQLLQGKEVRDFYVFHRRAFATREMGLRVRLLIGSGVPELQSLPGSCWWTPRQAIRWRCRNEPRSPATC